MIPDNRGDRVKQIDEPEILVEDEDLTAEESAPTAAELDDLAKRYKKVTGHELPRGPEYPHAGNVAKKLKDHKGTGTALATTIDQILVNYMKWREHTEEASSKGDETAVIGAKVAALEDYHTFLDTEAVDAFDSRGALVSSALEEFCYYLLEPIIKGFPEALIGKQDTYQGLHFTAGSFRELISAPIINTPVNTLDFIIGATHTGAVTSKEKTQQFPIRLPAVAIECKGYLDRPRFIESQNMARAIKNSFPQCRYILVAQCLKLNLKKIGVAQDIDDIYVLRRMQNIDRKIRRQNGTKLAPIYVPAVIDLYETVKEHLTKDWELGDPFETGILK
jgi:hypothetical protein